MQLSAIALNILLIVMASSIANAKDVIHKKEVRAESNSETIKVNVITGSIGDVNYRSDIAEIERAIGNNRIKKATEDIKGNASDVYIIDITGHKIKKHRNAVSFSDRSFEMDSGLGVGSRIRDFTREYGDGALIGDHESLSLCFKSDKPRYYFCVDGRNGNLDDENLVAEIWIW